MRNNLNFSHLSPQSPHATFIEQRMADPSMLARMIALSEKGQPAISALDAAFHEAFGSLEDSEKQAAGRFLRDVLSRHGLRPIRKGQRVAGGRVFRNGSVYAFVGGAEPRQHALTARPSATERVDEAIAILAAGRFGNAGTVDDFIDERRREARLEIEQ